MISLILFLVLGATEVTVISLPAKADLTVAMSPAGKADIKRDGTLSNVRVEIERLQPSTSAGANLFSYVVWAVSPEGVFENLGELSISGDKGRLEATTRFDQLAIVVTAEPHYMVDRPSSIVVYRNQAPRDISLRRVNVQVEVGAYDYSSLEVSSEGAAQSLVRQARSAFQIALNAKADRWAESEFRSARIALDTMEEMLKRSTPMDIVYPMASEAVRRSQLAFNAARERIAIAELQAARNEAAGLKDEKLQMTDRLHQLAEQVEAANKQIQILTTEVNALHLAADQSAQEKQQIEMRLAAAASEISGHKAKQQELQGKLSLSLRPEFFDKKGLTPLGREALARLCGMAEVIAGPMSIENFPNDAAFQAVMQYLSEAAIPQERIMTRR